MTRFGYVIATVLAVGLFAGLFAAVAILDPHSRVIWNASASAPIGLYRIHPDSDPPAGSLVAVMPPPPLARWLAGRRYLPEGVPLLKHVAAKAGQRVCRKGDVVSVDARPVAIARARDGRGRSLPIWQGCRTLKTDELLLLNPSVPDSLDGRYFGPLPASALLGRATPILTRKAPHAPLEWRGLRPCPLHPPCQPKGPSHADRQLHPHPPRL
ncbi:S26 family signal peptidase [Sphingobium sp. BYY-5]|uniref:S26 family signal peptidase n=1 Tax=Sphingobium sp. BYY-5 TaxID=2926400 RepID=UPI001FA75645|nr:S26 family signal peptidase [Sphingobium sp. BYY-5]MCI4591109.1 S26 family signal peptidase [Sphingobium sp. BYY-5]